LERACSKEFNSTRKSDAQIMTKNSNSQIFRFIRMNQQERRFVDGRMRVLKRSSYIHIHDEAREVVERIFDKYGLDIDFYFMHDYEHIPWALIIFTEERDIAGHIVSVRRGLPHEKIQFTAYDNSDKAEPNYVPKVGVIHMPSKRVCEDNSKRSPLFKEVWDRLKHQDSRGYWILVVDILPDELVELSAEDNASLWNKHIERRKRLELRVKERHDKNL